MTRIRVALGALVVVVIAAMWYVRRTPADAPAAVGVAPATAPPRDAGAPVSPSVAVPVRPPAHATRISPEQRRQLADRIAAAQAARDAHATAAGPPPSLPPPDHPELTREQLDALKTPILQALRETVPLLQACFQQAAPDGGGPAFQIRGELTLTGDADIGTLVDAGQLTDDRERPLPAALDDCLRNELQHIELPPLREGDKARVIYVFSDDK